MIKLLKNNAFKIRVALGFLLFLLLQLYDYIRYIRLKEELNSLSREGISIDVIWHWGLPFSIFYGGDFIFLGLIVDILVAIIFSFILGFIFKFVWEKLTAKKLK